MCGIVNFTTGQNRIVPDSKCAIWLEPEPDSTKVPNEA